MSTPQQQQMDEMVQYLRGQVSEPDAVGIDVPLVSSGLVDSLALVSVLAKLEEITHRSLPLGDVQPKDLETVRVMFETAARLGK